MSCSAKRDPNGTWHIEKTQYQYRIVIRGKRGCF